MENINQTDLDLQQSASQNMPAHLRQRLEERKQVAAQQRQAKEQKMKSAEENASLATIQKMQKAQEHNQRVFNNEVPSRMLIDSYDMQFLQPQSESNQNTLHQVNGGALFYPEKILRDSLAKQEQKRSQYENKLEQAALRRDMQLTKKIQNVAEKREKNKRPENVGNQKMKEAMFKESVDQFLNTATEDEKDAWMKTYQEFVQKRAKEAEAEKDKEEVAQQESSLKPEAWTVENPNNSESHDQIKARMSGFKEGDNKQKRQKLDGEKDDQVMESGFTPQGYHDEDKKETQNVNVNMPLSLDLQVKKNVDEKQTMEIKDTKVMYAGGNKITFNIAININVEPVE